MFMTPVPGGRSRANRIRWWREWTYRLGPGKPDKHVFEGCLVRWLDEEADVFVRRYLRFYKVTDLRSSCIISEHLTTLKRSYMQRKYDRVMREFPHQKLDARFSPGCWYQRFTMPNYTGLNSHIEGVWFTYRNEIKIYVPGPTMVIIRGQFKYVATLPNAWHIAPVILCARILDRCPVGYGTSKTRYMLY